MKKTQTAKNQSAVRLCRIQLKAARRNVGVAWRQVQEMKLVLARKR